MQQTWNIIFFKMIRSNVIFFWVVVALMKKKTIYNNNGGDGISTKTMFDSGHLLRQFNSWYQQKVPIAHIDSLHVHRESVHSFNRM